MLPHISPLNGSLPFLPHHHILSWEQLLLTSLTSVKTRIPASHFTETATW